MGIPKKGEIWNVNLDPTRGHEQQKRRPCLVLSQNAFNQTGLVSIAPITSGSPGPYAGFESRITPDMGMKTYGAVLSHQVRSVDFSARDAEFVEVAAPELLTDVLARYKAILGI